MADDLVKTPQVVGTAGPVDPELWVVRFDSADGKPFGAFVNFSVHVNTHFGTHYSADYPGVIASEMSRVFGAGFTTVFTPGACANINTTRGGLAHWHEAASFFAQNAVSAAQGAIAIDGPVAVGGTYYLQAEALPPEVLIASLAPGRVGCVIVAHTVGPPSFNWRPADRMPGPLPCPLSAGAVRRGRAADPVGMGQPTGFAARSRFGRTPRLLR